MKEKTALYGTINTWLLKRLKFESFMSGESLIDVSDISTSALFDPFRQMYSGVLLWIFGFYVSKIYLKIDFFQTLSF